MPRIISKTKYKELKKRKDKPISSIETTEIGEESALPEKVEKRFSEITTLLITVGIVLVVMVAGIIIDTIYFHIKYNNDSSFWRDNVLKNQEKILELEHQIEQSNTNLNEIQKKLK